MIPVHRFIVKLFHCSDGLSVAKVPVESSGYFKDVYNILLHIAQYVYLSSFDMVPKKIYI